MAGADAPKMMPPGSKCAKCKETLGLSAIHKGGLYYHRECFVCAGCNGKLDFRFNEVEGKGYCRKCYLDKFAPKCHECKKPMEGALTVIMLEHEYHQACVKCTKCRRPLSGGQYFEFQNNAYCLECHWQLRVDAARAGKQPNQPNPAAQPKSSE